MGFANWLQPLVVDAKYCCSVFLRKSVSLREFYNLLMVGWVCCRFVTVKGVEYGEGYGLGFCGQTYWKVQLGKLRLMVASDRAKLSASALINVEMTVEKWPLTVPLYEIKICGVAPFFYIKKMKQRILQACSLKHSVKSMVSLFWAKLTYLSPAGGLSNPLPYLPLATPLPKEFCKNGVPKHFAKFTLKHLRPAR